VLTLDEWLDYYNEYKSQFKIVESSENTDNEE
jgi:hypothetical protein